MTINLDWRQHSLVCEEYPIWLVLVSIGDVLTRSLNYAYWDDYLAEQGKNWRKQLKRLKHYTEEKGE